FFETRSVSPIPLLGMHSVTVPGAVAGWYKLHERYGKLPMVRILAPAIEYAEKGFPVSDIIAAQWQLAGDRLRPTPDAARDILLDGRAPRRGDIVKFPKLSQTLRQIAEGGRDVFYKGEIAQRIVEFSDRHDGTLTISDFAEFDAQWVEPVS